MRKISIHSAQSALRKGRVWFVAGVLLATSCLPFAPDASAGLATSPDTFNAGNLATWQANGRVWAVAQANGLVFTGGNFTRIRPPGAAAGTSELVRGNFAVFNAATGNPTSCAPKFVKPSDSKEITVRALSVSPDKKTLYIGGDFVQVNGSSYSRLAAMDVASCTMISSFKPRSSAFINTITATSSAIYVGGYFTKMNNTTRYRAAALRPVGVSSAGGLLPWAPVADKEVRAILISPDGTRAAVGGYFDKMNGAASHALAVVNTNGGSNVKTYNGFIEARSTIKVMVSDGKNFYTGNEGSGGGVFDGRIAINWSTLNQVWRDRCLGATQALALHNSVLYSGHHAHDCKLNGAFADGPRYHLLAQTTAGGHILPWFPNTNDGLGEALGPRAMTVASTGSGVYLWVVGEFTTVNGRAQQGLTRFGTGGANLAPTTPVVALATPMAGRNYIHWRAGSDSDNPTLTYRLYREGRSDPLVTKTVTSWFWQRPQMSFSEASTKGSTHRYKVTVTDGVSTRDTGWMSLTTSKVSSRYRSEIGGDKPTLYYRFDGANNTFLADEMARYSATITGASRTNADPLKNDDSNALAITSASRHTAYTEQRLTKPGRYAMELWFKTTTKTGGSLMNFGDNQVMNSKYVNDSVYMLNGGKVAYGVAYGTTRPRAISGKTYNDGKWHHLVTNNTGKFIGLYIDGVRVAYKNAKTGGLKTGYWKFGGDKLAGWDYRPSTDIFEGYLDEVAVYPRTLTMTEIKAHNRIGRYGK